MPTAPLCALYYPHTSIRTESLLKTSLLLWDHVECIAPMSPLGRQPARRDVAEASELIIRHHFPSPEAKQRVHRRLSELLMNGPPAWMRATAGQYGIEPHYLMYADKLLDQTWEFLANHDLVAPSTAERDYQVPPALGLLSLAILADECGGTTRTTVTDRQVAYSWLFGVMANELGGEYLPLEQASHVAETYDRLITTTMRVLNTDPIPLKRILAVRKRHEDHLRPLRKRYLERLASQVENLVNPKLTTEDKAELSRTFELDMRSDFSALKKELGYATKGALFSKEIGICTVAVAGAALAPASLPTAASVLKTIGVGALLSTHSTYRKAREKAISDHPMSWLYVASKGRQVPLL